MDWAADPYHSFTLLRSEFDAWLAGKAEEAGALLACGIRVDELLMDGRRVQAYGPAKTKCWRMLLSWLTASIPYWPKRRVGQRCSARHQVATGVKQIIELPAETISQRFQLEGNNGAARLFVGDCSNGMQGGGFLYTNKSSLSLGLVINAGELQRSEVKLCDIMEDFKSNPRYRPSDRRRRGGGIFRSPGA